HSWNNNAHQVLEQKDGYISFLRSDGIANTEFPCSLAGVVREESIEADGRHQYRDNRKDAGEHRQQAFLPERCAYLLPHGDNTGKVKMRVQIRKNLAGSVNDGCRRSLRPNVEIELQVPVGALLNWRVIDWQEIFA